MDITTRLDSPDIATYLFPLPKRVFSDNVNGSIPVALNKGNRESVPALFFESGGDAATVILFSSTTQPLQEAEQVAQGFVKENFNVLLPSYPCDSDDIMSRTVSGFFSDGQNVFESGMKWLEQNNFTGPVFVMGQTLGAILSLFLAVEHKEMIKGLFLESCVSSTNAYLTALGVPDTLLSNLEEDGLPVLEIIEDIKLPTLFYHGGNDPITPVAQAEKLQATSGAKTKQFFVIPGGKHENLYREGGELYFQTLRKFSDTVCGVNTWRDKRRKFSKK